MQSKIVNFYEISRWDPISFQSLNWKWDDSVLCKISDVLTKYSEEIPRHSKDYKDIQLITIHFDGSIEPRSTKSGKDLSMKLYKVYPGDIVLSKIDLKNGAVGIAPDIGKPIAVTSHFAAFKINKDKILPEFFLMLVQNNQFKDYLWRNKVGAEGRKEVKLDFFENIKIPVPEIRNQKAIIDFWTDAKNDYFNTIKSLETIQQDITDYVYNKLGVSRISGHESKKYFTISYTQLCRWDTKYFNQGIVSTQSSLYEWTTIRKHCISSQYGLTAKATPKKKEYRFLRITDIDELGEFYEESLPYVESKEEDLYSLKSGDLIVARSGSIGKCTAIKKNYPNILFASYLIRFTLDKSVFVPFLEIYLNNGPGKEIIFEKAYSAGRPNINAEVMKDIEIPLPPYHIQEQIADNVESLRNDIKRVKQLADEELALAKERIDKMIMGEL